MMRRRTKLLVAILTAGAVLVAARIAAPNVVERYANRQLASLGEYRGTVADVDLFLWRGGYALRDLTIVKVASNVETPFVAMPRMDVTLQWAALVRGRVVGEVTMHSPVLNFVTSKADGESQLGAGVNWPQAIRDLFPFQLNVVEARNGLVTFRAPGIRTDDSMTARDVHVLLYNLTNVQGRERAAFADLSFDGRIMGNAPVNLVGSIDPNEQAPTFDIDLSLEGARLVDVNPWLREFLKVDAQAGTFSMYAELAGANGRFEGYVRPVLENPEIFDANEDAQGPFQKAWEALVGFAAKILENRAENQVATQIPLSGEIENPDADILAAIVNLLRNAFVAAFAHSLEGSITLRDVAGDVRCIDRSEDGRDESNCERR
jgi:uncharacterized protein DUF748